MTDKEKLVALIRESGAAFDCFPMASYIREEQEKLAEYLLAHGIAIKNEVQP